MKILIWDKGFHLKSIGGPIGYMYNIHEYIKAHGDNQLYFYSDVVSDINSNTNGENTGCLKITARILRKIKFFDYLLFVMSIYHKTGDLSKKDKKLIEEFDFVHVHHLPTLMKYFSYSNYRQKVIYTTHFPEPLFDEITKSYGYKWILKLFPSVRNFYHKKEADAIRSIGHVMLPVAEAVEVYVNQSDVYRRLFEDIKEKMFYVPTAIFPEDAIKTNEPLLLDKYNLPNDSLKVCYIGRHNEIKGYDKLQEIARKVWDVLPNTKFIIGGKEEPMKGIKDERWIELGWVNTFALLNEIDVFILPNQQTFFDLILIEVLRQGVPCIISNTGGNKWFEQFNLEGLKIFDYNNVATAVSLVGYFKNAKDNKMLSKLGQSNHKFFVDNLTVGKYISNYINQVETL